VLAIPIHRLSLQSGLAAVVVVTCVRLAVVALILGSIRLVQHQFRSSILALSWGGLRGGLSIALALAVPVGEGRSWILTATYVVVVFSIVIQGGSMDLFLHHFSHPEVERK